MKLLSNSGFSFIIISNQAGIGREMVTKETVNSINTQMKNSLKNEGIYFDMVLDEGSIISNGIIKGADRPVAVVGIAEKGYVSMQLTCAFNSGHSSMPGNETTIGKLSKAIARLERYQMKSSLISPIRDFFSYLGPELQARDRFVFSNICSLS